MVDRMPKTLEREATTGDPSATGRLVLAGLRTGTLTEDAVRLAGFLRDPRARLAAEGLRLSTPYEYEDTPRWLGVLAEEWPFEPAVGAVIALARRALDRCERFPLDRWSRPSPPNRQYREVVTLEEGWIVSKSDSRRPSRLQRVTEGRREANDASEAIGALGRVVYLSVSSEWNEAEPPLAQHVLASAAQTFVRDDRAEDKAPATAVRADRVRA